MSNLRYWVAFNLVKGIGPAKLQALLDYFGSVEAAWGATQAELRAIGIDSRAIKSFETTRARLDLDTELRNVEKSGVDVLCWESENYPNYLRNVPNAPPVIYVKGDILPTDKWAVAIVGTRRLTAYGQQMTREITAGLVNHGVTIVSGLARGIDSIAHKTAVDLGGRTLAVMGSGMNHVYPAENRQLAKAIANGNGAVISEFGIDVKPEGKNFPPRNRVIAGLSLGTIVIEAGAKSGALITTSYAREQGREVYALPGPVTNVASVGPNRLIQEGAKLITCADDVLQDLNLQKAPQQQAVQMMLPESAEEAAIVPHLKREPVHVDELSRLSGLPAAQVSSTLTLMELKGAVQQVGGMNYVLLRESGETYN